MILVTQSSIIVLLLQVSLLILVLFIIFILFLNSQVLPHVVLLVLEVTPLKLLIHQLPGAVHAHVILSVPMS